MSATRPRVQAVVFDLLYSLVHPGTYPGCVSRTAWLAQILGAAATLVALTHSGWDRRADGASARTGYDSGWEIVLGAFAGLSAAQRLR